MVMMMRRLFDAAARASDQSCLVDTAQLVGREGAEREADVCDFVNGEQCGT